MHTTAIDNTKQTPLMPKLSTTVVEKIVIFCVNISRPEFHKVWDSVLHFFLVSHTV